jgi:hypothetical protein
MVTAGVCACCDGALPAGAIRLCQPPLAPAVVCPQCYEEGRRPPGYRLPKPIKYRYDKHGRPIKPPADNPIRAPKRGPSRYGEGDKREGRKPKDALGRYRG